MIRPYGTKTLLALALGLLFVILSVVVVVLVNGTMKHLALTDAAKAARMFLDHNLAVHTYFSKDLKPKLFAQLGPTTSKDYFEPVWMSSTYAVRKMDQYFRHFNKSPYYYKECAINARSPENEADDYEKAFLVDLQDKPQLTTKSAIRVVNGKPYFTLLRRGEVMEKSCLRCHSSPENAPGDLVRRYGPDRSFHKKVDETAQAISIRIPLSDAFSSATDFSYFLSGLLLVALGGGFLLVWVGNRRLLINPIAEIREHAVRIASGREPLGETIPRPKIRELRDLVAAFNEMSTALKETYDEQEQRILERTQELAMEKERLATTMRSIGDGVISTDTQGRVLSLNQAAETLTGWSEHEAVGRDLQEVFCIVNEKTRRRCENPVETVMQTGRAVGLANHTVLIGRDGTERVLADSGAPIRSEEGLILGVVLVFSDVTEQARAEEALRESEARVRMKLESIISPDGDIGTLELADVIDAGEIQAIMDDFYGLTNIGVAILDLKGKVLIATGWQDICTKFHRVHPETNRNCMESDTQLSGGIEEGTFKLYRCRNNMWDIATPIVVGGQHLGNLFLGQFLFEDEAPDYDIFRSQARKYGFDEKQYLAALDRVPRWSKETVDRVMRFYAKMTHILSRLSFSNIELAQSIAEREHLFNSLRESEQRYRLLADNTLDVIWQMDLDLCFTYVNPAILPVTGYTADEWIGTRLPEHCDEENFMTMARVVSEEISKGIDSTGTIFEAVMLKKNKEPISVEFHGKVILGENGMPIGLQGVTRNITDRKKAEQALRESEEKYRLFVETANEAVFVVQGGVLRFVNRKCMELTGYSDAELLTKSMIEFVHPDDREMVVQYQQRRSRRDETPQTYSFRIINKDGDTKWLSLNSVLVSWAGSPASLCFGSDVTEHKKVDEALKESNERYQQLARVTREGIAFHDRGVVLDVNLQFSEMFGYEHDELLGKQATAMLIAPESIDLVMHHVESGFEGTYEVTGLRKDGTKFPVEVDTRSGELEGRPVGITTIRDMTERKNLEEQLRTAQKMEAIGTLAGGVAHDFNNLLHIIAGHAELLEMDFAERNMRFDEITAIRQASRRGADLVKQILTFSRKVDTKFASIKLNQAIQETERLLYRTIPKMIEIDLRLEDGLWQIRADSTQMEQLLINLAVNAQDAMPEGGTLTIETRNVVLDERYWSSLAGLAPGRYVLLRISDTGHGMKDEVLQHIFEPFFTTKGLADGTGLGLATVFGIVKMHGGHVTCESEVGKGTSFSVYFPAAEADEPDADGERESPKVAGGTETILVVDDEPMIRDLAKKMLEKSGYSVLTAGSGKEGVEVYGLHKSEISLVILDLIMPKMGGKQCLEELLKVDPQVMALIASGFAVKGDTKTFLDTAAKGIVAKPFNISDMLRTVRRVLDGTEYPIA